MAFLRCIWCVHAAFRVSVWMKYAVPDVHLSGAVWGGAEL